MKSQIKSYGLVSSKYDRGAAFFDVDDTLINIKTMFSFLEYLKSTDLIGDVNRVLEHEKELLILRSNNVKRDDINRYYYRIFKSLGVNQLDKTVDIWFQSLTETMDIFNLPVVRELRKHQDDGVDIVFVSGSCQALLKPIGKILNVEKYLSAPLEVIDGYYTGNLYSYPMIGQGKADALNQYVQDNGLDLELCYAYGDDISDLPMLNLVGKPRLVNPDKSMLHYFNKYENEENIIQFN